MLQKVDLRRREPETLGAKLQAILQIPGSLPKIENVVARTFEARGKQDTVSDRSGAAATRGHKKKVEG